MKMKWTSVLVPIFILYAVSMVESRDRIPLIRRNPSFHPSMMDQNRDPRVTACMMNPYRPGCPTLLNGVSELPKIQVVPFAPVNSTKHGEEKKKSLKSDDEKPLPIPESIPERLQKYCKNDPESKFCVDLGLGKKDKKGFSSRSENEIEYDSDRESESVPQPPGINGESEIEYDTDRETESEESDSPEYNEEDWAVTRGPGGNEDHIGDDDWAVTRRPGEEEEEEEEEDEKERGRRVGGKIDCKESPEHPGCQKHRYLDQFIAWKIGKDCEVDPNGPFCPKTLAKGCHSSSESSSSESSSSEESEEYHDNRDLLKLVFTKLLHKNLDEIREDPTSKHAEAIYRQLGDTMETLRRFQRESSTMAPESSTPEPSTVAPESTTSSPSSSKTSEALGALIRAILEHSTSSPESNPSQIMTQILRYVLNTRDNSPELLVLLENFWKILKPGKSAPGATQDVYIGQNHPEDVHFAKPIATYSGIISSPPKSYLNFY